MLTKLRMQLFVSRCRWFGHSETRPLPLRRAAARQLMFEHTAQALFTVVVQAWVRYSSIPHVVQLQCEGMQLHHQMRCEVWGGVSWQDEAYLEQVLEVTVPLEVHSVITP